MAAPFHTRACGKASTLQIKNGALHGKASLQDREKQAGRSNYTPGVRSSAPFFFTFLEDGCLTPLVRVSERYAFAPQGATSVRVYTLGKALTGAYVLQYRRFGRHVQSCVPFATVASHSPALRVLQPRRRRAPPPRC